MGEAIGARSIDLEWVQARSAGTSSEFVRASQSLSEPLSVVQVHPTGLVEPDDPEAKIKLLGEVPMHHPRRAEVESGMMLRFLAAEALRGVGGLGASEQEHRLGLGVVWGHVGQVAWSSTLPACASATSSVAVTT